jgi:hypothetical protein
MVALLYFIIFVKVGIIIHALVVSANIYASLYYFEDEYIMRNQVDYQFKMK